MLTLKILTLDRDSNSATHIFYGERITHSEIESSDYQLQFNRGVVQIGSLGGVASSEQKFTHSFIQIFDTNGLKDEIAIMPHADCYIMEGGKTVDTFSCVYK